MSNGITVKRAYWAYGPCKQRESAAGGWDELDSGGAQQQGRPHRLKAERRAIKPWLGVWVSEGSFTTCKTPWNTRIRAWKILRQRRLGLYQRETWFHEKVIFFLSVCGLCCFIDSVCGVSLDICVTRKTILWLFRLGWEGDLNYVVVSHCFILNPLKKKKNKVDFSLSFQHQPETQLAFRIVWLC